MKIEKVKKKTAPWYNHQSHLLKQTKNLNENDVQLN